MQRQSQAEITWLHADIVATRVFRGDSMPPGTVVSALVPSKAGSPLMSVPTVMLGENGQEVGLAPLACISQTHGGRVPFQIDNVLAAMAAAWSLGRRPEEIRLALESFTGERQQVPGRFEVLRSTR